MPGEPTTGTELVVAARAGDPRALEELVVASMPLVDAIVRRALPDHPDADDVVQDVMVRAFRRLAALRRPERYRSWLAAIAVKQIGTRLRHRDTEDRWNAPLAEVIGTPDPGAPFEEVTALELELSEQRRGVARADRWLDPDDRVVLSLWLLEVAGELTRADVAAALGTTAAHAGVRVQRMRRQLEISRELVAALDARPRCPDLGAAAGGWNGRPGPLWRKRLARHTRVCPVCRRGGEPLIPVERLLPAFVLPPVPIALTAAAVDRCVTPGRTLDPLLRTVAAHPVAASIAAGVLVTGAALAALQLPAVPPAPRALAQPPAATTTLVPGRPVSLEADGTPGSFVTTSDDAGVLTPLGAGSSVTDRRGATFTAVAGLANPRCWSLRTREGRYLRHSSWRFRLDPDQDTTLFRGDATFCPGAGATDGSITLEASNYPGWFLHRRGSQLWVDQTDHSDAFRAESSFRLRPALAD